MKTLNFEHILIFVAISIFPLYFFDSGSLQVSHYFLILFSVFVFFNRGFFIANKIYFLLLFTFLGYMAFRQFIFLIEFNKLNLMPIVFFIFNLCIFFTLGSYISRNYDYLIDFLKYYQFELHCHLILHLLQHYLKYFQFELHCQIILHLLQHLYLIYLL